MDMCRRPHGKSKVARERLEREGLRSGIQVKRIHQELVQITNELSGVGLAPQLVSEGGHQKGNLVWVNLEQTAGTR